VIATLTADKVASVPAPARLIDLNGRPQLAIHATFGLGRIARYRRALTWDVNKPENGPRRAFHTYQAWEPLGMVAGTSFEERRRKTIESSPPAKAAAR